MAIKQKNGFASLPLRRISSRYFISIGGRSQLMNLNFVPGCLSSEAFRLRNSP
jgi:hypothetical protein